MKNFTVRAEKYFGMGIFSLFVLILSIFTACKQPTWNDPVREYLEYYTETAAVEDFAVVQSYLIDKDGNVCISSFGEETKEILLYMRNPKKYPITASGITGTGISIDQDSDDPSVLHLTYPQDYLLNHECGGDIGGVISLTENVTPRDMPDSYELKLKCNSAPPVISDGAVMINGSTYYLCFNLPIPDAHSDLKKITINDGNSSRVINCHVNSGNIVLDDSGNLSTTAPSGTLSSVAGGASFTAGQNHLYYSSGITAQDGVEQAFTITLEDEAGLTSSTVISTASRQIRSPVVKDAVENSTISATTSSSPYQLVLDSEYNAQVGIGTPTQLSNGEGVSGVTVKYKLKLASSSSDPAEATLPTGNTIVIENTGEYTLKVWAEKAGYLSSPQITYNIKVRPLRVTFNANSGTITVTPATQDVNKNTATSLTSASSLGLSKTGYEFLGWATSAGESVAYADIASITLDSDITLYAKWQAKKYNVTFNAHDGKFSDNSTSKTVEETYDAYYTLPSSNPSRTGYTFDEWYTASTGGTKITASTKVQITSTQTLHAHWTANKYSVTFNANGGNFTGGVTTKSIQETYNSNYTLPSSNPSRTGYTFGGWYTTTSTGGTKITSSTEVQITSAQTLYARWTADTYTVTFNANGAYFSGSSTTTAIQETYDANYVLPTSNPTMTGYTFAGWYTASSGGSEVTSSTKFQMTGAQTLYAHWNLNYYSITKGTKTNGAIANPSCTVMSGGKYGYSKEVTVTLTSNTGYGLYTVFVDNSETGNHLAEVSKKETSATTTTITFNMPAYDVTINCTFKPAYTVDISSTTASVGGDGKTVKTAAAGETVRLWIVDGTQAYTSSSAYKDVPLDSNGEYHGYICLPGTSTSLTNARVCAMTVETIGTYGESGFGYHNVSSNNVIIYLDKFYFAVFFKNETGTSSGDTHKTVAKLSYNETLGENFPSNLGFKYQWVSDGEHTGLKTETSAYSEASWSTSDDGTRVMMQITTAGIKKFSNNVRTIGD
ncbi:MAG: InlB B-repeat-containing protein [Treponema sp.]|nr:InlB B-repeat-containing protein [Treponema sp.]